MNNMLNKNIQKKQVCKEKDYLTGKFRIINLNKGFEMILKTKK